jgi:sn-glycerol 3-phosphate transport system permease protein
MPYLFVLPTLVLVFVFTLYPAARSVMDSLYRPPRIVTDAPNYVGLENYLDLFDSSHHIGSRFGQVLVNTLIFAFASTLISLPLALLFALLLNRRIRLMGFWRFSIFYPSLLPLIGAASIWAFLFSDTLGVINTVLGTFGIAPINWLGSPTIVLWSVIVVNIWKQAGYYMIFYLAGLQNIPRELYEAADLDGASGWQQLLYLTLPLLRRTTLFILIIMFTFSFQTVEQLQALGEGGPGDSSNLLLYFIFQNISSRRNWGYVNAMTVILVAIVMLFTVFNFVYFERKGSANRGGVGDEA